MVRRMSQGQDTVSEKPEASGNPEAGWFGDRAVEPGDKTRMVHGVFDRVARRYDLMNDLMSAGIHRAWKAAFIDQVRPRAAERLLDVAGGTGDIAFRLKDRAPDATVTICDLTEAMVRVGRDRAFDRGFARGLNVVVGNAEALPVGDRSVDAYTIAFGLRNVTHIDDALAEARRVLKPGGRFLCLEFSTVVVPLMRRAYEAYSSAVIPRLGEVVVGDRDSYQYLVESIRRFPSQPVLAARMREAGFARTSWRNLTGGIAAIHIGWRV